MPRKPSSNPTRSFTKEIETLNEVREPLREAVRQSQTNLETFDLLQSVSQSLYDEMDKLSKKSPAATMTDLALEQVNQVIQDAKEILRGDAYIDRIKQFVPAGDNAEHRDAVVILGQIRSGLVRGHAPLKAKRDALVNRLAEAEFLLAALKFFEEGGSSKEDEMKDALEYVRPTWFQGESYNRSFNFDKLGRTDLRERFHVE